MNRNAVNEASYQFGLFQKLFSDFVYFSGITCQSLSAIGRKTLSGLVYSNISLKKLLQLFYFSLLMCKILNPILWKKTSFENLIANTSYISFLRVLHARTYWSYHELMSVQFFTYHTFTLYQSRNNSVLNFCSIVL